MTNASILTHTDFKVKSHGAGAYCGGHLAAQLVTLHYKTVLLTVKLTLTAYCVPLTLRCRLLDCGSLPAVGRRWSSWDVVTVLWIHGTSCCVCVSWLFLIVRFISNCLFVVLFMLYFYVVLSFCTCHLYIDVLMHVCCVFLNKVSV